MIALRPYQQTMLDGAREGFKERIRAILLQLATGGGKCLGKGTPVLMFDGTVKPVEDVRVGDLLVGPDSKPRTVLSTCKGQEMLYRVTPTKGESYVVNESHILSLRYTGLGPLATGYRNGRLTGEVVNISVRDYLSKSATFKHIAKGWRSGVDWTGGEELPVDPYFLGIWLGDGTTLGTSVTSVDAEVVAAVENEAEGRNLVVRAERVDGKTPIYHVSRGIMGSGENSLRTDLRRIGVWGCKHIPIAYKTASRAERLALLAGLVDSDGHLSKTDCYDFVFKSERLANDVIFLARSLGFAAYRYDSRKVCGNNGIAGDYHRFMITGGINEIPSRLFRKQSGARSQKKNVLNVGIKVEPIGIGDYYGFEIDGDHLFLLGDFTVTHNTVSGSYMIHGAAQKGKVCWWLTHRRELIGQTSRTFSSMGIVHGIIQGGHSTDPHKLVQIGSIQTVARRLDKLTPPDLIIFDECHHLGAGQWQAVFDAFPDAKIIGLTATPWRLDGVGLGRWFGRMVNGPTVKQLIEAGALSKYRLFAPHVPDLSSVGTQAGDLKRDELAEVMDKPSIVGDAVKHYQKLCPGKRAVAFAVNIEHSRHIVQQFQLAGIAAEHVDGTMDTTTRDAAIQRFIAGETLVLSNCELFGEGFDVPAIEAVILLRPTKSLSLYLQQVGRALRPAPGKDYAIILDHAGNSLPRELNGQGHGFPDDDRTWSLEDREKRKAGEKSEVAIRTCPECFAVFRPVPECPNCGHVYVAQVREIEQVEGDLKEIDVEALRRAEMQAKKREQGQAETLEDLIRVARSRGQKHPEAWARHVLQGRIEAQQFADSIGLTPMQVKAYRKEGMPAASKGAVAALMWIRAEKPSVFQWIEREHPEVFTGAVLREIADERVAA